MFAPASAGACALPPENKRTGSTSTGPSAFAPLIVMINWLEGGRFKDAAASGEGQGPLLPHVQLFCFVYLFTASVVDLIFFLSILVSLVL